MFYYAALLSGLHSSGIASVCHVASSSGKSPHCCKVCQRNTTFVSWFFVTTNWVVSGYEKP